MASPVDWQSTKNTVLERNSHMLNNSDMSDIRFTCEGSDKTFYAHKYVLATSSAVFHAMFYGGLAKQDPIVHLRETTEEGFEQFLRFLYTDECVLTTDNIMEVFHLAKFYILPSLNEKCVHFLTENFDVDNVLDVLEQAIIFDDIELEKQCWNFIALTTGKVVASDGFSNISQTTVTKLLMQKSLTIREVELFQAVFKWIDFQCRLKNLEPTNENRRSVIGEAIYAFRFFSMSQAEFDQHVSKSGLLTAEELVSIHEWKQPDRRQGRMIRFSRFGKQSKQETGWSIGWTGVQDEPDVLDFTVDTDDVIFQGVRLFGDDDLSQYNATLEVSDTVNDRFHAFLTGTYTSEHDQDDLPGFDVMLKTPIRLKKDDVVTVSATFEGPPTYFGEEGEHVVTQEGVSVAFGTPPPEHCFTATSINQGQFHEIILWI